MLNYLIGKVLAITKKKDELIPVRVFKEFKSSIKLRKGETELTKEIIT